MKFVPFIIFCSTCLLLATKDIICMYVVLIIYSVTLCVFGENSLITILYTIFNFKPEVVGFR